MLIEQRRMAARTDDLAELKRFTFFVSPAVREVASEFSRSTCGFYFTTLAEPEEWLTSWRRDYPGALGG